MLPGTGSGVLGLGSETKIDSHDAEVESETEIESECVSGFACGKARALSVSVDRKPINNSENQGDKRTLPNLRGVNAHSEHDYEGPHQARKTNASDENDIAEPSSKRNAMHNKRHKGELQIPCTCQAERVGLCKQFAAPLLHLGNQRF